MLTPALLKEEAFVVLSYILLIPVTMRKLDHRVMKIFSRVTQSQQKGNVLAHPAPQALPRHLSRSLELPWGRGSSEVWGAQGPLHASNCPGFTLQRNPTQTSGPDRKRRTL